MKEFMYLFRGGDATEAALDEEHRKEHMRKWGEWMQLLSEKGALVAGQPLKTQGKIVEKSGEVVTDGPFAEGKEIVGGYLMIKAADIEEAAQLSKDCPIFEYDGSVEVREIAPME